LAGLTHRESQRTFSQESGRILVGRKRQACLFVAAVKMQPFMWISLLALGAVSVAVVSIYLFIVYCALSHLRLCWGNEHDSQTPFSSVCRLHKEARRPAPTLRYDTQEDTGTPRKIQ